MKGFREGSFFSLISSDDCLILLALLLWGLGIWPLGLEGVSLQARGQGV